PYPEPGFGRRAVVQAKDPLYFSIQLFGYLQLSAASAEAVSVRCGIDGYLSPKGFAQGLQASPQDHAAAGQAAFHPRQPGRLREFLHEVNILGSSAVPGAKIGPAQRRTAEPGFRTLRPLPG